MERKRGRDRERICLICQKFFNLIYSCQDAEDPDLITAFYLPDFTPGTIHSSLTDTHTLFSNRHTHTHTLNKRRRRQDKYYSFFKEHKEKLESKRTKHMKKKGVSANI